MKGSSVDSCAQSRNIIFKKYYQIIHRGICPMNFKEYERTLSERFDVLAQREDNWDGYDSKKPTKLTLVRAENLIGELFDSIISAGHPWLTPFISSDEDGNVTVEWCGEGRRLHIQIGENEVEYIQVWGINIDTEMHVDFLKRDDYLTLWEWLLDEKK